MRTRTKLIIAVILIALPIVGRWIWFYRGGYAPPSIPEIDETQMEVSLPEYTSIVEEAAQGAGRVLVDLGHANNLEVDDLTPLRDRLIARGAAVQTFDGLIVSLESQLRGATALIVAAPTFSFTPAESDAVVEFVADGGRVLLIADPTRPVPLADEQEILDLNEVLFPESAIPAVNSVANPLGVIYFDDYVYNLVDNEGNYRNVRLATEDGDSPLTQDLETVVFFASHSLRSDGPALLQGDENTLSSLRTGETGITAAALSADGGVLALGDLTVLTAPYHTVEDNDQFLSNVANWLMSAEREWDLRDFPYLFQRPVNLVQLSGDELDPRLIAQTDPLADVLALADLTLELSDAPEPGHDVILLGVFDDVEMVQDDLDDAGVTITIVTEEATPVTIVGEEEEPHDTIEVQGLGTVPVAGTTLFVVRRSPERVSVIALAENGDAAVDALNLLTAASFSACAESDDVMVCSTGEAAEGVGLDEEPGPPEAVTPGPEETPLDQPRIGSLLESQSALAAGVPWLLELAEESYDETSQAGETYVYTVALDPSQDALWVYGWCTTSMEILEQNWEEITLLFTVNEQEVPLSSFAMLESDFEDQVCRLYYALVTDWPLGVHELLTEITFETELNDGQDTFPAGTHYYQYIVTVGG